jgi:myo-inositol-1(or 4)-monophosphatase
MLDRSRPERAMGIQRNRFTGGIGGVGYSPRVKPDDFLQVFSKLLQRGGMFYREGSGVLTLCYVASGSLIGYVEQHINSWNCLGALAIIQAAGGKTNEFLANDGLWKGNRLIAGPEALYPTLESFFECLSSLYSGFYSPEEGGRK